MVREIPLSGSVGAGMVALVDDEDFERVAAFPWRALRDKHTFYAVCTVTINGRQRLLKLHREVLSATQGVHVDHRDGDGLNCRKRNLRFASPQQNARNRRQRSISRQPFKGIGRLRKAGKEYGSWFAILKTPTQRIRLGPFAQAVDAARAYDALAREVFGEFARVNFPEL